MTKLKKYLKDRGPGATDAMASALGLSKSYLYELARGDKTPGLHTALDIEKYTGGTVPANGWARENSVAGS